MKKTVGTFHACRFRPMLPVANTGDQQIGKSSRIEFVHSNSISKPGAAQKHAPEITSQPFSVLSSTARDGDASNCAIEDSTNTARLLARVEAIEIRTQDLQGKSLDALVDLIDAQWPKRRS